MSFTGGRNDPGRQLQANLRDPGPRLHMPWKEERHRGLQDIIPKIGEGRNMWKGICRTCIWEGPERDNVERADHDASGHRRATGHPVETLMV